MLDVIRDGDLYMWVYYFLMFYIIILGLILGTSSRNQAKKELYLIVTFGPLLAIAAFRAGNVGNDTNTYLRLFADIASSADIAALTWRYEIGYVYLNKLVSLIATHPQMILVVTSLITMTGFARFIFKYSEIPWMSTYLLLALGYFDMSMNTIRLCIAIVVVLLAYDSLSEQKPVTFLVLVALASSFHRVAVVFLLAWPITRLGFSRRTLAILAASGLTIFLGFRWFFRVASALFPTYQYYVGSFYLDGQIRLASVLNMLVGLSVVLFGTAARHNQSAIEETTRSRGHRGGGIKTPEDEEYMLLLITTGVMITFISFRFNLLGRAAQFFAVFSCVYLPNSVKHLKDRSQRLLFGYLVVVLFFAYYVMIHSYRPEWNRICPYRFWWQS